MNSQSTLKNYKSGKYEYLYIYFKHKKNILRINTGKKYVVGMHKKDLFYNTKMQFYRNLNQNIQNLKNEVDIYIMSQLQHWNPNINQKDCMYFIETGKTKEIDYKVESSPDGIKKTVLEHFDDFYRFKQTEIRKSQSLKDYKSLWNALIDYETTNSLKLENFNQINDKKFFYKFRNFLSKKHKGITKGELNDNTVHKRMSSLKTFMRWVEENGLFSFNSPLYLIKFKKFDTDFVTLNRTEIQQLQDLQIENPKWQRIIDVFICNCFMSLRFSDLSTMEKGTFAKDDDGDFFYTKTNEKTGKDIEIPILPTALSILEKYDFDLPSYTNQYFNRQLLNILKHYDLFSETVKKNNKLGGEIETTTYKKRDLITSHTARRSFITNAISNNVSLNNIQASTGHTQLSSLSKYVKRISDKEQLKAID